MLHLVDNESSAGFRKNDFTVDAAQATCLAGSNRDSIFGGHS